MTDRFDSHRAERGVDIPCAQIVELVTEYLEGALPDGYRRLVDDHLGECPGCRRYVEQLRRTIEIVGVVEESDLSTAAWQDLRTALFSP